LSAVLVASGCASAPKAPPTSAITRDQKISWILQLEDHRVLHETVPAPPPDPKRKKGAPVPPPPVMDLALLAKDDHARIRRRAALAIGRTKLPQGVAILTPLVASDPEPEVRQMAAFALGLIGRKEAAPALRTALSDASPVVRGRAAEALGLIGDTESAAAIGVMVGTYVKAGVLAKIAADESAYPLPPEIEAARLGIFALTRLKAYDALAGAVLDGSGAPVSRWWPVAYAFRRVGDPKAVPALRALLTGDGAYTRAFAARGLGALKDTGSVDLLMTYVRAATRQSVIAAEAVRALGEIGDRRALPALTELLRARDIHPGIRTEAVRSIGQLRSSDSADLLLDLISDPYPAVRAEALIALARSDPERFVSVLSGLDTDKHWTVRAALATALAELPAETAAPLLEPLVRDADQRAIPTVLGALAKLKTPNAGTIALEMLKADDAVVRGAAAKALGEIKPQGAVEALQGAARYAERDAPYTARAAALEALVAFGRAAAEPSLTAALKDKDWAVRVKAAELLRGLDPSRDLDAEIRPAPSRFDHAVYGNPSVVAPPVSTHVYIDTDKGTIQIELEVLEAPLTVKAFTDLAREGYFGGVAIHRVVPNFVVQDGDPRGDGEGGPGYTIRDELNERPYLRGTVGMALDWADTGGSQFFITHSPQPHLDARYTVFGQVISGMDVVDKLAQGDLIRAVRVWNGPPAPAAREASAGVSP
jgi:cyclophilin family peptidyl-prolyl cis-trans isomerase/HEAT repeat protein